MKKLNWLRIHVIRRSDMQMQWPLGVSCFPLFVLKICYKYILCVSLPCLWSQPPLPEEDYPSEDYSTADQPDAYESLHATGHPSLAKEYSLSHVNRTSIPRANLDRSTPTGWNLNVEPNGTWVFTSEHSADQVRRKPLWEVCKKC